MPEVIYKMIRTTCGKSDAVHALENKQIYTYGSRKHAMDFVVEKQLKDCSLWKDFVDVFRRKSDDDNGFWRCEYWGKMMRGACMVYLINHDYNLYRILTNSVYDIISTQDKYGRISSYTVKNEFKGWDMWGRKYVMLGMEYYLEICKDERFSKIIIDVLKRQADYIISKIGKEEDGKLSIFDTTEWWGGLNSCSILEPFVRLYYLTKEKRYLDFSEYLISTGFCSKINIIEASYSKKLYPYQFPFTKAYEMMSCFEGLLEYYRICGNEKYKTAVVNFVDMVAESDVSVIGCCGCTHELFDNSAVRQTEPASDFIMQETCVTVTWMKLCMNLFKLTSNSKYIDLIEQSGYNALMGSVNFKLNDLKYCSNQSENYNNGVKYIFDSYSPLYYDKRGKQIGGHMEYKPGYYYGCCNCIGAAGVAILNQFGVMSGCENEIIVNDFKRAKAVINNIEISIVGDLNKTGCSKIIIKKCDNAERKMLLRIPEWLNNTSVKINGKIIDYVINAYGYCEIDRIWSVGDCVEVKGCVEISRIVLNNKIAFKKGAVVLARDEQVGENFRAALSDNSVLQKAKPCVECEYAYETYQGDKVVKFIDYASAGQNYDEVDCNITVWSDMI